MKKLKVMMMCCLLIGCVGMFAACGANDNNAGNTQNNAVTCLLPILLNTEI